MKFRSLVIVLVLCSMFVSISAFAQETKDWSVSLGMKTMYAEKRLSNSSGSSGDGGFMLNPILRGSYKDFFLVGSYAASVSDFEVVDTSDYSDELDRKEIDVLFGYNLSNFAFFLGYKWVLQDGTISDAQHDLTSPYDWNYEGLTLGASAAVPLFSVSDNPVFFSLSAAYIYLLEASYSIDSVEYKFDGYDFKVHGINGFSLEPGIGIQLFGNLSALLSYRYQRLLFSDHDPVSIHTSEETVNFNVPTEEFKGLVLSFYYSF